MSSDISLIPVSTRRRFDVNTTSITLKRRHMDVKTTLCAYWDRMNSLEKNVRVQIFKIT